MNSIRVPLEEPCYNFLKTWNKKKNYKPYPYINKPLEHIIVQKPFYNP